MKERIVFFIFFLARISRCYKLRIQATAILKRFILCSSNAKETETREDYFYARPVGRSGGIVRQNSLPGHIHARRGGAENQPAGVPSSGQPQSLDLQEEILALCGECGH